MGWLGDVAGALTGGVVSGLFGMANARDAADRQAETNEKMMNLQHNFNVSDYQHRYQWAVNDLRSAGLNPILAATNGIGGSINGTGLASASAVQAPTPDISSAFNSANQISSNREIAKMQNEVALGELQVKKDDVNSAIEKRKNDMAIENGRLELEKWVARENIRLKELLNDATIKNMADRLQADIEHMARQDANGAVSAAAAMAQANASGLMAAVQERLGISREELNKAQEAYIALQSENAEESLKWQRWLNDHPGTRGAVGLLGSFFDTFALVKGVKNIGNSLGDVVGGD